MPPAPPRAWASATIAWTWSSSAGPGSTIQHGSRPTTHVFVPLSVNGPGLFARSSAMSCPASTPATLPQERSGGDLRLRVLADPALEIDLGLEVGVVAVVEADAAALEDLDEDLDERAVELGAADAAQLGDRLGRRDRLAVGVARRHHVVGVGDRDHAAQQRHLVA